VLIAGLRTPAIACSVVVVVVVVVVVGTSKDWGPENKLPELILEFAWCSFVFLKGVHRVFYRSGKQIGVEFSLNFLLLVKASWTVFFGQVTSL